jgi:hypothetical protein
LQVVHGVHNEHGMSEPNELEVSVESESVGAEGDDAGDVKVSRKKLTLERKIVNGMKVETGVRAGAPPGCHPFGGGLFIPPHS